jgi:hypothetical protein
MDVGKERKEVVVVAVTVDKNNDGGKKDEKA